MRKLYPVLAIVGALLAACGDGSGPGIPLQFSREVSFPDFRDALLGLPAAAAARAEIELPAIGRITREVNVEDPQQVNDKEEIESRITDLVVTGDQGTLTVEPGFTVTFTMATAFEAGDADLTFQQFVDRVQAALARDPKVFLPVEAKRDPLNPLALGPGDAFPASELELKDDVERPELEINVTAANLVAAADGDCTAASLGVTPLGCLRVLGVTLGIDATTELQAMLPGVVEVEFEGVVDCQTLAVTDAHNGSFSLVDGTVIQIDGTTDIEGESSGGDEKLVDLDAVKTACDATRIVRTEGEGVRVSDNPRTIRATEVEFEVEEQAAEGAVEFQGEVSAVDVDHRTVTVSGDHGTVTVHVESDALIDPDGDLVTLQAVSDAISASPPQRVRAEGHANPGSSGSPLEATDVKFQVDH